MINYFWNLRNEYFKLRLNGLKKMTQTMLDYLGWALRILDEMCWQRYCDKICVDNRNEEGLGGK